MFLLRCTLHFPVECISKKLNLLLICAAVLISTNNFEELRDQLVGISQENKVIKKKQN